MLGQVIHGYRVDRVLSADKGGFGEVFLATHVESGAEAVVKVLRAEMSANRETVTRFFNEARAAASIHHPGIVQIHNVGYHGDRAYLLMERLRGEDLETRLKAGRLPLDRALLFMRQTAGAIAAAHERGIVHRDLKPANLFIVRDPDVAGGERVRVLDFGIAKLGADARAVGATTGVFGTPMYMSPEQCASTGAVDHRSDLYSLGCIFYELVTGYPPFGRGGVELIAAHLRDAPTPPRDVVAGLPPAIDALILSLLEKPPERRMQSCAALVNALDGVASSLGMALGTGRSFPPPVAPQDIAVIQQAETRTIAPQKKRRSRAILVGALVVAAGATTAIVLDTRTSKTVAGASSTANAPALSIADARLSAPDAAVAMVVSDAAIVQDAPLDAGLIAQAPPDARPASVSSGTVSTSARLEAANLNEDATQIMHLPSPDYAEALKLYQRSYALDPDPAIQYNIARAQLGLQRCADARKSIERVLATEHREDVLKAARALKDKLAQCGQPAPEPGTDKSVQERAHYLQDLGKKALFSSHYKEAADMFRQSLALFPTADVYFDLGLTEYQMGDYGNAVLALREVAKNSPSENVARNAEDLIVKAKDEMKKQGGTVPGE